ncbi:IucA/IucC family protein [Cupriavidus basilensis]
MRRRKTRSPCSAGDGTPHALARTEQWGTGGHPWHPAYKTRLGLAPEQVIELSPEFEAQVPIGVVAVAAHRLQVTTMEGVQPYAHWFAATFPKPWRRFAKPCWHASSRPKRGCRCPSTHGSATRRSRRDLRR